MFFLRYLGHYLRRERAVCRRVCSLRNAAFVGRIRGNLSLLWHGRCDAAAIGRDGSAVVDGKFSLTDFGVYPVATAGAKTGGVLRLDPSGRTVRSITRLGANVSVLDTRRVSGKIAVA
jgi:hypothetical protein